MTPRMLSSARKCCPSDFFGDRAGSRRREAEGRARVVGRSGCSSVATSSPRASASTASVWTTFAGSLRLPRNGCGARYGTVGLGQDPVGRHRGGRLAEGRRLRVRHVAGERDVVPALERRLEQARRREAVEDHRSRESRRAPQPCRPRRPGCGSRPAGRPRPRARAARSKSARCAGARSKVVEVVEPGLADRDDGRVRRAARASSSTALGLRAARLVRIDPERGEDALLLARRSRAPRGTRRFPCRS